MRREMIAFAPAILLAGYWIGLEAMVLLGVTALAVGWMTRPITPGEEIEMNTLDPATGLPLRELALPMMDKIMTEARQSNRLSTCFVICVDEPQNLVANTSTREFDDVMRRSAERLRSVLRDSDYIARLGGARFMVMLKPTPNPDLESMIQLSVRLQSTLEEPLSIAGRSLSPTFHLGFCQMNRSPGSDAVSILEAAETAAEEASRNGPSAIRAYSNEIRRTAEIRTALSAEVGDALENGEIVAYFQPQICTDTGLISGMQAMPRWLHRERGVLGETDIMPAVIAANLRTRFYEVMMFQVFHALKEWNAREELVGIISLPINEELLTNPKMPERLQWEFDRFELPADQIRLVLEQDIVSKLNDDMISHTLSACRKMGCKIELAGFGNGPASINSVRNACAGRIRIHRSFVAHVDHDAEQQRLVAAIISLAEGLGIQTIAEGVSSIGEHAMLSQLGCNHVQGRGIATPMPLEDTHDWISRHMAKLEQTPRLNTRRGS
ncbi:GGDEF domain-containing phosphodiesterase [Thioclava litoralis]|uniref:GGDEF domain-containing phosphodiesterase n=1 Tax=Thioclava litoralis TaxID=3076557 RepID=A0ABZ1E2H7_9RHOB|nr:GGDEF domain-containing phosphodiesterase [Thioclava sp. FTW29]